MNFTREPIIETVITPREGCKLVIRSSKGTGQEEYFVDAVEVVSFGHSFFFRSQERPKSFLVPVSDYEILELKETRMVLKNVSTGSIKIGGGREAPREPLPRDEILTESRVPPERPFGKREKRRRGRRGRERHELREPVPQEAREPEPLPEVSPEPPAESLAPVEGEERKAPSFISKLFPPPPTLIKESLSRYKPSEESEGEEEFPEKEHPTLDETLFEHPTATDQEQEDENEE